jgi:dTDP-4-amino-4,6-dideoxygalactose transaminase
MNNLNATIALTQLECYEENLLVRKENFEHLKGMNLKGKLISHDDKSSYYVATLIADNIEEAKKLRKLYCEDRLYPPLHNQPYYYDIEFAIMTRTEEIFELLVNLPLYDSFLNK